MNCENCIYNLDNICVNADSIYCKKHVSRNILCPYYDEVEDE